MAMEDETSKPKELTDLGKNSGNNTGEGGDRSSSRNPLEQMEAMNAEFNRSFSLTEEDKSWKNLDSVHSRQSNGAGGNGEHNQQNTDVNSNDSCASFASFGGHSSGELGDSCEDLSIQKAAFTNLKEEITPRRVLLKAQSVRLKKGVSFRNSNLTLIDESNSLD